MTGPSRDLQPFSEPAFWLTPAVICLPLVGGGAFLRSGQ